jgi:general secretion pathway protein K
MREHQRGVALVLVLWVIALLAVIAGNFAYSMRGEAQIARNQLQAAQVRALADAGVHRAWFELLKPTSDLQRWLPDGQMRTMPVQGGTLQVTIVDESGKIDLNTASDSLLKGLFLSAGVPEVQASALLEAVLDWRDSDRLKRLNGAEEEDYRAAGKKYVPADAPFLAVNEFRRVLGVTDELYSKLSPVVTVYSGLPGLNTAAASREAIMAIPGVNPALVDQYLQQRQTALASGQKAIPFVGAGAFGSTPVAVSGYTIRSELQLADGLGFVREATVRLTQDPKNPIFVLAWEEGKAQASAPNGTLAVMSK